VEVVTRRWSIRPRPDAYGGLSVTEFAKRLGVSRVTLSRVVNGRAAVSAELAIRLAAPLSGSAQSWLQMQVSYDLWQAQKKRRPKIEPLPGFKASSRAPEGTTVIKYQDVSIDERLIPAGRRKTIQARRSSTARNPHAGDSECS